MRLKYQYQKANARRDIAVNVQRQRTGVNPASRLIRNRVARFGFVAGMDGRSIMRYWREKRLTSAIALTMSLTGLGGCGGGRRGIDSGYAGTPVVPPKPASDAELIDQRGRRAPLLAGDAATFLFFGYTHCPDECPLALASLGRAYRSLSPKTTAGVRIVFVTVDPARDTPAVIDRYVRKFDPHIAGFTGSPAELARVWAAYGVTVDRASHDIGHGDEIYAIDRTHHIVLIYPPDASASDLAKDAMQLATS